MRAVKAGGRKPAGGISPSHTERMERKTERFAGICSENWNNKSINRDREPHGGMEGQEAASVLRAPAFHRFVSNDGLREWIRSGSAGSRIG